MRHDMYYLLLSMISAYHTILHYEPSFVEVYQLLSSPYLISHIEMQLAPSFAFLSCIAFLYASCCAFWSKHSTSLSW